MKIQEVYNNTCDNVLKESLTNKTSVFVYGIVDKNYVLINGNSYDEIKQRELGIEILPIPLNIGGSLVISKGDIEVGIIVPESLGNEAVSQFVQMLINYFDSLHIGTVTFTGNDILINNYKVCGMAQMLQNGYSYVACHIAINVNLELIEQICTKKMEKIPKGLSEFGLTTEAIKQELIEWAKQVNMEEVVT